MVKEVSRRLQARYRASQRRLEERLATEPEHQTRLSDGIERMLRGVMGAERRGDRLFLHLQFASSALLLLVDKQ